MSMSVAKFKSFTHSVMLHSIVSFTMTLTFEPMSKCSPPMDTLVPPARGPFLGSMYSSFGTCDADDRRGT